MNEIQNFNGGAQAPATVMETAMSSRETAQIQTQMFVAQKCPRNEIAAIDKIMQDCRRPGLAEKAVYCYARGGSDISGPSIHLAKAIAKRWGNMMSGIVELEQRRGESVCEAYAIDLETNYKESKTFTVPHIRYTRKGSFKLEDPRDIYELVANNGSRRERACILSVIPGDIVEDAVAECVKTMQTHADISPESVKKMLDAFSENFGVSKIQIEKRIQRRIDAITPAQMVNLRNIFNSLKDGMSSPAEWFEPEEPVVGTMETNSKTEALADKVLAKAGKVKVAETTTAEVVEQKAAEAEKVDAAPTLRSRIEVIIKEQSYSITVEEFDHWLAKKKLPGVDEFDLFPPKWKAYLDDNLPQVLSKLNAGEEI